MSSFRNPVGPLPAQVYWRRRLIVAGVGLAIILILVLIIVRPGSGTPVADPYGPTTPAAPTEPAELVACAPADLRVEAVTDKSSYASGELPGLQMKVTNVSTVDCLLNAGSATQEFLIHSGSDRIWSSKDCQVEPQDQEVTLAAGAVLDVPTVPVSWERKRSASDACGSTGADARPGYYLLTVSVGGAKSAEAKQFQLR